MANTSARPISRTEIKQRVKGNIAIRVLAPLVQSADRLHEDLRLSHADVLHLVSVLEDSFDVELLDARTEEFWAHGKVSDLIDLIEGQVSQVAAGGIA